MADFPRDNLFRSLGGDIVVRQASVEGDESAAPVLTGHFAVFDTPTEIDSLFEGRFVETIAHGAFKKTFRENRDSIRALFQHGKDPMVGDKPLGPIEVLEEDDTGAYYEVPLLDTEYNAELLPGLRAGLYGASFRFRVVREDVDEEPGASDDNPHGLPLRTIREAQVYEMGPCTFPAYQQATAGVRSTTDEHILRAFLNRPEQLRALLVELLPGGTEEDAEEPVAPVEDRAELEAHPVDTRRASDHLFGMPKEGKPSWQL